MTVALWVQSTVREGKSLRPRCKEQRRLREGHGRAGRHGRRPANRLGETPADVRRRVPGTGGVGGSSVRHPRWGRRCKQTPRGEDLRAAGSTGQSPRPTSHGGGSLAALGRQDELPRAQRRRGPSSLLGGRRGPSSSENPVEAAQQRRQQLSAASPQTGSRRGAPEEDSGYPAGQRGPEPSSNTGPPGHRDRTSPRERSTHCGIPSA